MMISEIADYSLGKIKDLIKDDLAKGGYIVDETAEPLQQWQEYYYLVAKNKRKISGIRCKVIKKEGEPVS